MATFFSKKNTTFCCSVSMLLFIFIVLLIMVCYAWYYYFTLLNEMDLESDAVPVLKAIVHYCNKTVQFQWNMDCNLNHVLECQFEQRRETISYIQSSIEATINRNSLRIPIMSCGKWMVWSLPIL